jgi:hypothetical protein
MSIIKPIIRFVFVIGLGISLEASDLFKNDLELAHQRKLSALINGEGEDVVSVYENEVSQMQEMEPSLLSLFDKDGHLLPQYQDHEMLQKLEEKDKFLEEKTQLLTVLMKDKELTHETLSFYGQSLKEKNDQLLVRDSRIETMEQENQRLLALIYRLEHQSLDDREEIKRLQSENGLLKSDLKKMEPWEEKAKVLEWQGMEKDDSIQKLQSENSLLTVNLKKGDDKIVSLEYSSWERDYGGIVGRSSCQE